MIDATRAPMRRLLHRAVAAALACLVSAPPVAAQLEPAPGLAAIVERARARQLEIVATVKTSAHRQQEWQRVRGGRGRVRAEGRAVHAVRPRADGRFELSEMEREASGEASELSLGPPTQVRHDPEALTTAEAILRVLDAPERLRLAGPTSLDGREAWLLEFEAQPKRTDSKDLREQVRRASSGRLWVDALDGAVLRLETELERRVQLLGGKVRRAAWTRDQGPVSEERWAPVASASDTEMSVLTIERTTTTRTTFEGWEPAPH
jgi:hypothetical protein